MIPLADEENESYQKQKACCICKKGFSTDDDNKKYHKVRDHCHYTGKYRGAGHDTCNITYKAPKEIPVVFHNGSSYDYHFVIKELAKEFQGKFECLGKNTEKYITFQYELKKELDNGQTITYKLKFIDSFRFMSRKLQDLVDNLSKIYSKERRVFKKRKIKSVRNFIGLKNDKLHHKCNECKKG